MEVETAVKRRLVTSLIGVVSLLVLSAPLSGAERTLFVVTDQSRLELDGTTNIGSWHCKGEAVSGALVISASWQAIEAWLSHLERFEGDSISAVPLGLTESPRFDFSLPIDTLRCGNGRMERDLRNALKADLYPEIRFEYHAIDRATLLKDNGSPLYLLEVRGTLTLAGVTRVVTIEATVRRTGTQEFAIEGEIPLRMTSFDVEPPIALLGLIKARDPLSVTFALELRRQPR